MTLIPTTTGFEIQNGGTSSIHASGIESVDPQSAPTSLSLSVDLSGTTPLLDPSLSPVATPNTTALSVTGSNLVVDVDGDKIGVTIAEILDVAVAGSTDIDTVTAADIGVPLSVTGGGNNDDLNGSSASLGETAVYSGNQSEYSLNNPSGGSVNTIDVDDDRVLSPDGTDSVTDFEWLEFADFTISTAAPTVTSVAVPANGYYIAGQNLDFTVTYDKLVKVVSGSPTLGLTIGSTPRLASLLSGGGPGGSLTLTFRYTVQPGDLDTDGIAITALTGDLEDINIQNNIDLTLNGVASTAGVLVDTIQPTVAIAKASGVNDPTHLATIPLTINFSEPVSGLTEGEISVGNGTVVASSLTPVGSLPAASYTVNVTPTADGTVTVNIGAGAAQDAAGLQNQAATLFTIESDQTLPEVESITSTAPNPTNVSPIPFAILFSEDVFGLQEAEISITNGTIVGGSLSGSGDNYSFTVVPTGQGDVTVSVDASAVYDATGVSGNYNVGYPANPNDIFTINYDSLAPAAPVVVSITDDTGVPLDGVTSDELVDITGTAENDSSVEVFVDGGSVGTVTASPTGDWTITGISLPEQVAPYLITAQATDAATNTGPLSAPLSVTVDKTAPDAPTINSGEDDVTPVTGTLASTDSTNDLRPELKGDLGSAEAGSTITITSDQDGVLVGTATAAGDGSWSFTPSMDLTENVHNFTATATDLAGNASGPSIAFELTIDAAAPAPPVITSANDDVLPTGSLSSGADTNDDQPELVGAPGSAEANSTVTITSDVDGLLGTTTAAGDGSWSFTPTTALTAGTGTTHSITATATDAAGNVSSASTPFLLTIDVSAPTAPTINSGEDDVTPVTGTLASTDSTNDLRPELKGDPGSAEAGSTITITSDQDGVLVGTATAAGDGSWSFTPSMDLTENVHNFTATATDLAGNASGPSIAFELTIDAAAQRRL